MYGDATTITQFTFGWIVQGRYCTGGGATFSGAVENWINTVTRTMSPGGYYTKAARHEAKSLRHGCAAARLTS